MVAANGVEYGLRLLAELSGELHTDGRVAAFHFVVHRLPDVMEKTATSGDRAIKSELVGNHLAEEGDFDRMAKDVLAVTGPELHLAHRLGDLRMDAANIGFHQRILPGLLDSFFDVPLGLGNDLLDP